MKKKTATVIVSQDPKNEIATEVIASSIKEIADGMAKIKQGRLNNRALVILISEISNTSRQGVRAVLEAMEMLEKVYLKPEVKNHGKK